MMSIIGKVRHKRNIMLIRLIISKLPDCQFEMYEFLLPEMQFISERFAIYGSFGSFDP